MSTENTKEPNLEVTNKQLDAEIVAGVGVMGILCYNQAAPIGHLIFALHGLLKFYYKTDFSYTITANGAYLGASNAQAGRIEPDIEPSGD